jgi:hypothetical protein
MTLLQCFVYGTVIDDKKLCDVEGRVILLRWTL